jgi:hypothetical protein
VPVSGGHPCQGSVGAESWGRFFSSRNQFLRKDRVLTRVYGGKDVHEVSPRKTRYSCFKRDVSRAIWRVGQDHSNTGPYGRLIVCTAIKWTSICGRFGCEPSPFWTRAYTSTFCRKCSRTPRKLAPTPCLWCHNHMPQSWQAFQGEITQKKTAAGGTGDHRGLAVYRTHPLSVHQC